MNKSNWKALCGAGALLYLFCGVPATSHAQNTLQTTPATASADARRLTLSQAVTLVLQNNRDVLLAQAAVSRAEAEYRESHSTFRPEIFVGSGLAATKGFPLSIEGSAPSIFTVSTSQSLFNANLKNVEKMAGQMRASAEKSLEEKRDDVVAQTVLTYLDLDRSRRSVQYVRRRAATLAETEQIVAERVQAGLETPVEGTRARLNSARARSQTVGLDNQIALLEFTLRDLTGIPQSESIVLEEAEVPAPSADETLDGLVARALDKNQGIKALEDEVRAKEFQLKSEEALRWPRINLVGQYGLFSDINNFSSYFRKFSRNNITFGVSILMPVYAHDRFSARMEKSQAELASARYRWNDSRAAVSKQVRQLLGEIQQQSAAQEVARLELEVARRSLDAILAQYQDGRVNRLAVEQARSDEDERWVDFFQLGYLAEKARLDLLRITGEVRSVFR